ncbi:MAG: HD-GYP domain-containing protein [Sedimenticola sp.]|nr:HD-GYP domain-containing protein [Sedimenticola sp.]
MAVPRMLSTNRAEFLDPGSRALLAALGERDIHTQFHSRRVVGFAHLIGIGCGLDEEDLQLLSMSACFHDIGKIGIPDQILLKPARFTQDEMDVMKDHPIKGEGIINKLGLKLGHLIAKAVRHHHEHIDGGGYPDGLKGESIPYMARIIAVADSFDAMTEVRPYHPARSIAETVTIMQGEAGSKLDTYLVNKMCHLVESRNNLVVSLMSQTSA